jgi:hypothetical protein
MYGGDTHRRQDPAWSKTPHKLLQALAAQNGWEVSLRAAGSKLTSSHTSVALRSTSSALAPGEIVQAAATAWVRYPAAVVSSVGCEYVLVRLEVWWRNRLRPRPLREYATRRYGIGITTGK